MRRLALFCFALFLVGLVAACNASYTVAVICRGDSAEAVGQTTLVKCSTIDTLARR